MLFSKFTIAQAWLTPVTSVTSNSLAYSMDSFVLLDYQVDRMANNKEALVKALSTFHQLQGCTRNICLGAIRDREMVDIGLARESEFLSYQSTEGSDYFYMKGMVDLSQVNTMLALGSDEEGLLTFQSNNRYLDLVDVNLAVKQSRLDASAQLSGEVNGLTKRFLSNYVSTLNTFEADMRVNGSEGYILGRYSESWNSQHYRGLTYSLEGNFGRRWQLYAEHRDWRTTESIESTGEDVSDFRDDWSIDNSLDRYALRYQLKEDLSIGVVADYSQTSFTADIQCRNKEWGLSGLEKTLGCVFIAPYAEAKGEIKHQFIGIELKQSFSWDELALTIGNQLGEVQVRSSYELQADTDATGSDMLEEMLWVPSVIMSYQRKGWVFDYKWRQIIPISAIESAFKQSNNKHEGNTEDNGSVSSDSVDLSKNWLWPQIGGYHQITLSYQW